MDYLSYKTYFTELFDTVNVTREEAWVILHFGFVKPEAISERRWRAIIKQVENDLRKE